MGDTTAEAWKSYYINYEVALDITRQNMKKELENMIYSDINDFPTYIILIWNKWAHANMLGVRIINTDFKTIILNSLFCL